MLSSHPPSIDIINSHHAPSDIHRRYTSTVQTHLLAGLLWNRSSHDHEQRSIPADIRRSQWRSVARRAADRKGYQQNILYQHRKFLERIIEEGWDVVVCKSERCSSGGLFLEKSEGGILSGDELYCRWTVDLYEWRRSLLDAGFCRREITAELFQWGEIYMSVCHRDDDCDDDRDDDRDDDHDSMMWNTTRDWSDVQTVSGSRVDAVILNKYISKRMPKLYKHLNQVQFNVLVFSAQWLMCLFITSGEQQIDHLPTFLNVQFYPLLTSLQFPTRYFPAKFLHRNLSLWRVVDGLPHLGRHLLFGTEGHLWSSSVDSSPVRETPLRDERRDRHRCLYRWRGLQAVRRGPNLPGEFFRTFEESSRKFGGRFTRCRRRWNHWMREKLQRWGKRSWERLKWRRSRERAISNTKNSSRVHTVSVGLQRALSLKWNHTWSSYETSHIYSWIERDRGAQKAVQLSGSQARTIRQCTVFKDHASDLPRMAARRGDVHHTTVWYVGWESQASLAL